MILWAFPVLAVCGIWLAYLLKIGVSGKNLTYTKFFLCFVFNGFFVIPYMDILQDNEFLFLGRRPEILLEYPFIGWIAFCCIFIHLFALPVKREVKWWFSRK